MRPALLLLLTAISCFAGTFRLYMKDGDYQIVREYQVEGDRVRYYTTERGDWEEIPLSMIDLAKTEKERAAKQATDKKEAAQDAEEQQAMAELRKEIRSVPADPGAYFTVNQAVKPLEAPPYQVITNKKRAVLKALSPVPLINGKAAVIIDGEHSKFIVHDDRPNFYFRPQKEERFGIIRVTPKKGKRLVENITIVPVINEGIGDVGEHNEIPVFQQQLADNLYKVWPEKALEPGEYAVVEFSDDLQKTDDPQLQVWDFAYSPK